ncbi:MAG TPA: hypothetical protein VFF00_07145, partial [Candidatus Elarobacter sp.]|nr:hypothetical protein [Candidatus Elarobacter sp.]
VPYAFSGYIPVLRAGLDKLLARANRDRRALDLTALRDSIEVFATAARRADDAIARGEGPGTDRALAAAQAIDALAYGVEGYASVSFPDVNKAYASGSASALDAALASARAAIGDATKNLL